MSSLRMAHLTKTQQQQLAPSCTSSQLSETLQTPMPPDPPRTPAPLCPKRINAIRNIAACLSQGREQQKFASPGHVPSVHDNPLSICRAQSQAAVIAKHTRSQIIAARMALARGGYVGESGAASCLPTQINEPVRLASCLPTHVNKQVQL